MLMVSVSVSGQFRLRLAMLSLDPALPRGDAVWWNEEIPPFGGMTVFLFIIQSAFDDVCLDYAEYV